MKIGEAILLWVAGLWCLAGAIFNWPRFLNYWDSFLKISFKQEPGWHGKRVFWLLIGLVLICGASIGTIAILLRNFHK